VAPSPSTAERLRAQLVATLRERGLLEDERIAAAFGRVERHLFVPGHPLQSAYSDEALVTRERNGVPASSSSQPAIMAAMLAQLDVREGQRVLEVGAGTGYNAALLSELAGPGGRVTTVDLDPPTARAAEEHLAHAGHGNVRVLAADGAQGATQDAPFDRIVVTAGCWEIPFAWSDQLAEGGRIVLPLRVNATELSVALRREGEALRGRGAEPCGFMPLQGREDSATEWVTTAGWRASADVALDEEDRVALDRLLATPGERAPDCLPAEPKRQYDALLWLSLQGRPLVKLARQDGPGTWAWRLAVVLSGSLLVFTMERRSARVSEVRCHGTAEALDVTRQALECWARAGRPGNDALRIEARPAAGPDAGPLPRPLDGGYAFDRGGRRFELRFASGLR
jgi:protein-L-isoaspartate(D-aspartate) O-methyltransferase